MKQALQLKLGQQLTMTPQLQQAIKLLQLSTLDLQLEIQHVLQSNPMLELDEGDDEAAGDATDPREPRTTGSTGEGPLESLERTAAGDGASDAYEPSMPEDLPVDTQWEDLVPSSAPAPPGPAGEGADYDIDSRNAGVQSLHDHLLWQLNLTRLSDIDRAIALTIIDATDGTGRLTATVDELHTLCAADFEVEIERDEVLAVLHALQQFEPTGVFAADLQECLLLQLKQLRADTPGLEQARTLVSRHLTQLANGDFAQILRRMRLDEAALRSILQLLQTLDPFPGQRMGADDTEYVVPDVFVRKREGRWVVELNPDIAPRLRINDSYAGLIRRADNSAENTYLRDNLQEARWFLKSLQSRNETLLKVASEIVAHQRNFLEYGEEAMKPLVLHDIAEAVSMHESTISRVTTRKYMHTPRGIFELKYFFSSHVATTTGGACSSTAIRALIRKLIAAENPRKPLSDSRLAQLLEEQGIKVARRTIAKYRDSLFIPPSSERKRLV
ncbi:RNA polymerase factor sigma-54 [Pseudohaliea rubra]|uniref:RNA polymerase sigma-54 factor n=1 Tax=Pseudohaliea rubra DSM 19751 TaxID=1265313 RepID=A0A095WX85_9GAMM|nr:RNA polymerase factor sigma-54 [Pseudohaliea rubra]KGE03224.1 RNA polymerase sigma-54 factor RpoN [Pseudohaliea rubra DSM 19751]